MSNPNQSGSQDTPKTSPQSDNKPNPQQQQGGDKQDGSKPDQQQK